MSDREQKKSVHSASERNRRDRVKDSLVHLRDAVPAIRGQRVSKSVVLNGAADYMVQLQQEINSQRDDVQRLQVQNRQLQEYCK